jgi:DNA-binding NtrC family response regulator
VEEDVSQQPARILVVDDDPDIRGVIDEFLTPDGYHLRMASSAREAFQILEREAIDLVLTDLVMPDHDGIAMIQDIRSRFPGVKTVAMSGARFGPFLRAAELLGANATLSKPLNSSLLRLTVRQVLAVAP